MAFDVPFVQAEGELVNAHNLIDFHFLALVTPVSLGERYSATAMRAAR
jgi:hypothetical protein